MTSGLLDSVSGSPIRGRWAPGGLPGLSVGGRLPGRVPRDLLAPGALLLAGAEPGRPVTETGHLRRWGPMPRTALDSLIERVAAHGIVGAGGAGFPTDIKLQSLAGKRVSLVIVNGAEGESASGKDGALLGHVPHLVLDGAVVAARALSAPKIVVRIGADRQDLAAVLPAVLAERSDGIPIELSVGPDSFVAGEASAVIRSVAGGPALPTKLGRPPVAPGRWGRRRAHVLLSNVETFARVAVAVRGEAARSCLASVSGAVRDVGIVELAAGARLADLAAAAGGLGGDPAILITGGWHGRWVRWHDAAASTQLSDEALGGLGGRWGAGAFVWVPEDLPAWDVLAAVANELAAGTAGECGPCWRGLPAVGQRISLMAELPEPQRQEHREALDELLSLVDGRGICGHPMAAAAALRSALEVIGART